MELATIIALINSGLLALLLLVYLQNYRSMKTTFGLGLIVFSGLLMIESLVSIYFQLAMIEYYSSEAMNQAFILSALKMMALAALNWITWKE
ncbi:MAG: hypothetical protein HY917_04095 [Candidatus Diapherotrites archaeon]|nr:hypothetical protein [Candidatus Diapherotrites archaeon]